jgi:hypothetical protein
VVAKQVKGHFMRLPVVVFMRLPVEVFLSISDPAA